jgi:hypothetical protein
LDGFSLGRDYSVCNNDPNIDCSGNPAGPDHIVQPEFYKPGTSTFAAYLRLDEAFCVGCYSRFLDDIQSDIMVGRNLYPNSALFSICKANPDDPLCKLTVFVASALERFKTCTSGYAIDFVGPLCTKSDLPAIADSLDPLPYTFLANCAWNITANNCSHDTLVEYFSNMTNITSSDCTSCYREAWSSMEAISDTALLESCMQGSIYSEECRSGLVDIFGNFSLCAGGNLTFPSEKQSVTLLSNQTTSSTSTTTTQLPVTKDKPTVEHVMQILVVLILLIQV